MKIPVEHRRTGWQRISVSGMLVLAIGCSMTSSTVVAANTDKTLVSWVNVADKTVRAGSVLTIQNDAQFDGIVFAERAEDRWMAGSDHFTRTQQDQSQNPAETADPDALVQVAIVYHGEQITIYRNGTPHASYAAKNIDLLSSDRNVVVFGLRHIGGNGSFAGSIEDARIYDRALSQEQIRALRPNQKSDLQPYAWWDFEGDKPTELTGRFPLNRLERGAKLVGGKLVLGRSAVFVSARVETTASEPWIPFTPTMPEPIPETWLTFHLAHPGPDKALPGDPNCAIFYKGRYHLFYICQHQGHSFAHVSSTDMVHWKWHPTTLTPPRTGHGMYSGTAFMTKQGQPAIIYHGEGSGRNQIAFALDDQLEKWSEPMAVEPLTRDGKKPAMRHWDPDCWLRGDAYYSIAGGANPTLSTSPDLKQWEFLGELFHSDFPTDLGVPKEEDTSCANMFPIGDKWMLLCISHALGCRYYLGDFQGHQFLPEQHGFMNWASWDFFAPESLLTPDGRRVMWAWCTPWINDMQKVVRRTKFDALMNGKIQVGIQSLPRELRLSEDGRLRIAPLRELKQLRGDQRHQQDLTIRSGEVQVLEDISGDTLELEITFAKPAAGEFGVKVLCGEHGERGLTIASGRGKQSLTVGYINPPFALSDADDFTLRVFIDKSMIEVFAEDRQAAIAWHEYDPDDLHVGLFSNGGDVHVKEIKAWTMKSIYKDQ